MVKVNVPAKKAVVSAHLWALGARPMVHLFVYAVDVFTVLTPAKKVKLIRIVFSVFPIHLHIIKALVAVLHQTHVRLSAVHRQQVLVALNLVLEHRPTVIARALDGDRLKGR